MVKDQQQQSDLLLPKRITEPLQAVLQGRTPPKKSVSHQYVGTQAIQKDYSSQVENTKGTSVFSRIVIVETLTTSRQSDLSAVTSTPEFKRYLKETYGELAAKYIKSYGNGSDMAAAQEQMCEFPPHQQKAANADSQLDHNCLLNIKSECASERCTGIICTLGPASRSVEMLEKLIDTGMNIARLNFSHGSHEYHGETIVNLRKAVQNVSQRRGNVVPLGLALDTRGPEIRTGLLEGDGSPEVQLVTGNEFTLTTNSDMEDKGTVEKVFCDYERITQVVKPGDRIFVDDGLMSLIVKSVEGQEVITEIENGGKLSNRKGINLPGLPVDLPGVSEKDKKDLIFGAEKEVDMIFASFIRNADTIQEIRDIMGEKGKGILIISKIESQQGMENIDDIIEASDGIMVARGDLGIEIPPQKVFLAQKMILAKCQKVGKPVICATQMLESMTYNPRPTRAEVADVANAVLDGADCVMLSGETAKGSYPLQCVTVMGNICREAEAAVWQRALYNDLSRAAAPPLDPAETIAIATVEASLKCHAAVIIVCTSSGRSARLISRYRPRCPILAVTRYGRIARQGNLYRCILPIQYVSPPTKDWQKDVDMRVQCAITYGKKNGFIKRGDAMILVSGWREGVGFTNTMRIVYASGTETCNEE
ncbi:pyruvate kinase-like [Anabrus simplex]|uniref:pyruvate kinase-like n=1 Tax=Anabrus simplex TaxID=316456 RepID=UPI0035A39E03